MYRAKLMVAFLLVGGCSSSGSTKIGSAGGTVSGAGGAAVTVPPGALSADTSLAIDAVTSGYPALPSGAQPQGSVLAFTPHGQTFAVPVTITVPFSGTQAQSPQLMSAQPGGAWSVVAGALQKGSTMQATVSHFSFFAVVQQGAAGDGGGSKEGGGGPIDGAWTITKIVCDNQPYDMSNVPETTLTINNAVGSFQNKYCTVPLTISYSAPGNMEWVVGQQACPGIQMDAGVTSCVGTRHPTTYTLDGSTLTMSESPAPACEAICAGKNKVTTLTRK
jgi:hypothetical protein